VLAVAPVALIHARAVAAAIWANRGPLVQITVDVQRFGIAADLRFLDISDCRTVTSPMSGETSG
jgi:hypothetical protein